MEQTTQLQMAVPANLAQEEDTIDLLELFNAWKRHWAIILASTLAAGILGGLVTAFLITPQYEATSSIYVVSASANSVLDLSDLNLGTSLAKDYAELVMSRTMLLRVLAEVDTDLTWQQLEKMTTVSTVDGTRILKFTVRSTDVNEAVALANSFSTQALKYLPEKMGVTDNPPTEIDSAIAPEGPCNIHFTRNVAIGLALGFLASAGIITLLHLLNDTFNSPADVENYLGVVPLTSIPETGSVSRNKYYYNAKEAKNA